MSHKRGPLPDWLSGLQAAAPVLKAFGTAPVGFILGSVLSVVLGGFEAVAILVFDGLRFLIVGSDPGTEGTLGFGDIPTWIGEAVLSLTNPLGGWITTTLGGGTNFLIGIAELFGPFGVVVLAAEVSLIAIGAAWVSRQTYELVLSAIPGLGVLR